MDFGFSSMLLDELIPESPPLIKGDTVFPVLLVSLCAIIAPGCPGFMISHTGTTIEYFPALAFENEAVVYIVPPPEAIKGVLAQIAFGGLYPHHSKGPLHRIHRHNKGKPMPWFVSAHITGQVFVHLDKSTLNAPMGNLHGCPKKRFEADKSYLGVAV